jgi:hypothetical protein
MKISVGRGVLSREIFLARFFREKMPAALPP